MKPILSIIVPIYNVEKYLEKCLDSLIKQNIKNYEIICVNDGSRDNSLSILKKISKENFNIKIINQKNAGLSSSRNVGIRESEGKYIMFVDSDDFITENILKEIIESLEEKDIEGLYYNYTNYFDEVDNYSENSNYGVGNQIVDGYYLWDKLKKNMNYMSWLWILKKDFIVKNNLFFKENIIHEDLEYFVKLIVKIKKIKILDKNIYFYRRRKGSITTTVQIEKKINSYLVILDSFSKILKKESVFSDLILNLGSFLSKEVIKLDKEKKYIDKNKRMLRFFIKGSNNIIYNIYFIKKVGLINWIKN